MDFLTQDLRVSLRALLARPAFTIAAVITLALGIGATTTVFSIVFGVLMKPLPYPEPDRIVAMGRTRINDPGTIRQTVASPVDYDDWRQRARTLEAVALYSESNISLTGGNEPQLVSGATITSDFFRVFGKPLTLGREFSAEETGPNGPFVAIISYGLWRERYAGDPTIIGKTIDVSGRPRTIVGVAPRDFDFPSQSRIWVAMRNNPDNCGRGCVYLNGVGRLKPGATVVAAKQDLKSVAAQIAKEFPETNTNVTVITASLRDYIVGDVQRPLYILFGAITLVLLIACANVANLLLVRGAGRSGEIAVRATLGASRWRIIRQLLTESLVVAIFGAAIGLLFAGWALDAIRLLSPGNIPRLETVSIGAAGALFALALTFITAMLFGLYPAYLATRASLASALRAGGRGDTGPRNSYGRSLLLAAEVAFSVLLLLGAGLLVRSFIEISKVQLGFNTERLAQVSVNLPAISYDTPEKALAFQQALKERIEAAPGVESVSITASPPLSPNEYVTGFRRLDQPEPEPGKGAFAGIRLLDEDGLRVLGMRLIAGRNFEASDRNGTTPVALITRALAQKYFQNENAIGKQIRAGIGFGYPQPEAITIVGIVDDIRGYSLTSAPEPELYLANAQHVSSSPTVLIRARSDDASALLNIARAEIRRIDPSLPMVRPGLTDDVVRERMAPARFYMSMLVAFAVLAIVLAAIGIYGVVAYVVTQRTREIGVRIALGAGTHNVVKLVLWQGLQPAIAGLAVGVVGALAAGKVVEALLFEVGKRDPVTFVLVPVLVIGAVALACVLPARRASQTPPAIALRADHV